MDDTVSQCLKEVMTPLSTLSKRFYADKSLIEQVADRLSQGGDEMLVILTRKPYSKTTLAAIFQQLKRKHHQEITDIIDAKVVNETTKLVLLSIGKQRRIQD